MVNKPKAKGTAAETRVVNYLLAAGLRANRVVMKGNRDEGDVHILDDRGYTSVVLEIKAGRQTQNYSRATRGLWLQETEDETSNHGRGKGYLVIARFGRAVKDYEVWSTDGFSFWHLDDFAYQLAHKTGGF
jgi:hypothetical protein